MAGLVGYASSDDEDVTSQKTESPKVTSLSTERITHPISTSKLGPEGAAASANPSRRPSNPSSPSAPSQPIVGPVALGPSLPPPDASPSDPALKHLPEDFSDSGKGASAPPSPFSANRALIHHLTLPSIPNLDIPASPPGSPPPGANQKMEQFLHLKRRGTHFNSKLESSTALRNPSLMDKLLSFVDLSGPRQYETTLPPELYDPGSFPRWAYRKELRHSREEVLKEREGDKAAARGIEFVPASSTTPVGGLSKGEKRKSGWK
ncbi:uncharacterized protein UV8b_02620 [Ustilaginoidea virens]|uniref:HCNGP-like protein n=1 Tax=Ustilaginoidea virens TaxID=1159556 RepID=A0A8E5HMU4_USTVR|nr:uncharacterized protein UV8b_02620 [Ustilaginoidea virens]QUC18379.1 hypothetical protein UV8b_02620 [Ustilaginoidea virens]